jgi:hypothetical protein
VEKEVVAKDGINKLKLFHICGTINPESTSFNTLSFAPFSKGMDLVVNQPRAGRAGALSDLLHQSLSIAREEDIFNIRSTAVTLRHVSKSMTAHMLSGNLTTDEAVSLDNKAHAIDPSVFLPQKNPALVNREISGDLHACSKSAMDILDSRETKAVTSIARIGTMQNMGDFTCLCINSDTVVMGMFSLEGPQPLYQQFLLMFIKIVNSCDWVDWFAKNDGNMPGLHWHLYVYVERIFSLLADFLKNFGNVNVVTGGRPISELDTRSLTKTLRVMKAFITQVDLVQSTNSPIIVCRSNIYKYEINPVNNTKCALSGYSSRANNAKSNGASPTTKTPNSHHNEAAKRDSAVTPDDNSKKPANQRLKKPHHSVAANSTKGNVTEMGRFFLSRPDMKASDVFPKGMAELVCVNFTCKGRECTKENCTFVHPRKVGDLKRETVNAIGKHFLKKRVGWFNEWHFLKVMSKLPKKFKQLMGGPARIYVDDALMLALSRCHMELVLAALIKAFLSLWASQIQQSVNVLLQWTSGWS